MLLQSALLHFKSKRLIISVHHDRRHRHPMVCWLHGVRCYAVQYYVVARLLLHHCSDV